MAKHSQQNQRGDLGRRRARRDEDLKRLKGMTKALAVGSVAAVGIVSGFVAHAIPGHAATPSSGSASTGGSQPAAPSSGTDNQANPSPAQNPSSLISPPSTAPAPTQSAPRTSSGATGW